MTPTTLAQELGVPAGRVRAYLRTHHPRTRTEHGAGWLLTPPQVEDVRRAFAASPQTPSPAPPTPTAACPVQPTTPSSYRDEWYWEGNVQDAVCRQLASEGWEILQKASTAEKQRGDDIVARRGGTQLVVEVKGYPWTSYADPRRSGEVKRTNPTVQAKHWFAEAVLRSIRTLGTRPGVEVAIALPDFPRYRNLYREVNGPLAQLTIQIIWIAENDVRVIGGS